VLVDTCVWIEFFRSYSETGEEVESLIKSNSVWVCGVILFELVQGIKSKAEKSKIQNILSSLNYVKMPSSLWQKAGELSAFLKSSGLNIPMSDILISAVALEYNLSVFTVDKHLKHIPHLTLYPGDQK